jgi:hypothetical protein
MVRVAIDPDAGLKLADPFTVAKMQQSAANFGVAKLLA